MLKRLGYFDIFIVLFFPVLMYRAIDFNNISKVDSFIIGLYIFVVALFIIRICLIIVSNRLRNQMHQLDLAEQDE